MTIIEAKLNWASTLTKRKETSRIILHHAAASSATVEKIHQYHLSKGWSGIGYHFYIRKSGEIYRGRPEDAIGAHAATANSDSIGICFEGNFEIEVPAAVQVESARALIAALFGTYGELPLVKHCEVGATACPGGNFPAVAALLPAAAENTPGSGAPDSWAKEAVDWAVELGLFQGDGVDFRWREFVTREELAVVLARFCGEGKAAS